MNAAEHKARAEELLAKVEHPGPDESMKALALVAQIALVHATLATIPDPVRLHGTRSWEFANPTMTHVEGQPYVLTWLDSEPDQCVIAKELLIDLAQRAHPGLVVQTEVTG